MSTTPAEDRMAYSRRENCPVVAGSRTQLGGRWAEDELPRQPGLLTIEKRLGHGEFWIDCDSGLEIVASYWDLADSLDHLNIVVAIEEIERSGEALFFADWGECERAGLPIKPLAFGKDDLMTWECVQWDEELLRRRGWPPSVMHETGLPPTPADFSVWSGFPPFVKKDR